MTRPLALDATHAGPSQAEVLIDGVAKKNADAFFAKFAEIVAQG